MFRNEIVFDKVQNEIGSNCLHKSGTFSNLYRSSHDPLLRQISSEPGSGQSRLNARQIRTYLVPLPNGSGIV